MIKQIKALLTSKQAKAILSTVDFSQMKVSYGHRRRAGANGVNNLSDYQYLRKDRFDDRLNKVCAELLPKALFDNYLQIHILHLTKGGLLDKQVTWQKTVRGTHAHDLTPPIASFVTIALRTRQNFIVETKKYTLNIGDAMVSDPEHPHEVKPVSKDETYLVVMLNKTIAKRFADEY